MLEDYDYYTLLDMAQKIVDTQSPANDLRTREALARKVVNYAIKNEEGLERAWLAIR